MSLCPYLPIIMLTAFGDPTAVRRGYEAGADDFLHKPVDTPALILKVRAFLRLKSLHDELMTSREEARAREVALAKGHVIEGPVLAHLGGSQHLVVAAARGPPAVVRDPAEAQLAQAVAAPWGLESTP